jgi:hypothetical protein
MKIKITLPALISIMLYSTNISASDHCDDFKLIKKFCYLGCTTGMLIGANYLFNSPPEVSPPYFKHEPGTVMLMSGFTGVIVSGLVSTCYLTIKECCITKPDKR